MPMIVRSCHISIVFLLKLTKYQKWQTKKWYKQVQTRKYAIILIFGHIFKKTNLLHDWIFLRFKICHENTVIHCKNCNNFSKTWNKIWVFLKITGVSSVFKNRGFTRWSRQSRLFKQLFQQCWSWCLQASNMRERKRMGSLNDALKKLKTCLPENHKIISKQEILVQVLNSIIFIIVENFNTFNHSNLVVHN